MGSEPSSLGAADGLIESQAITARTIEEKTERAEARREGEIATSASLNAEQGQTCAELFRPGDLWVRWLDRDRHPARAPRLQLTTMEQLLGHSLHLHHTYENEQLWKIEAEGSSNWDALALREQRARMVPPSPTVAKPPRTDASSSCSTRA